jgi:hypothetical protein
MERLIEAVVKCSPWAIFGRSKYKNLWQVEAKGWPGRVLYWLDLASMLAVFVYIAVSIILRHKYLDFKSPIGFIRFKHRTSHLPIDTTKLNYCNTTWLQSYKKKVGPTPLQCRIWSRYELPYSNDGMSEKYFVPTRVTETTYERICEADDEECARGEPMMRTGARKSSFVAGVEHFPIWVEHVAFAGDWYQSNDRETWTFFNTNSQMPYGRLMKTDPDNPQKKIVVKEFIHHQENKTEMANDYRVMVEEDLNSMTDTHPREHVFDQFTVAELLEAGGINSLDEKSFAPSAHGASLRNEGIVALVTVHYDNHNTTIAPARFTRYTYTVEVLNGTSMGRSIHEWEDDEKETVVKVRAAGVLFVFMLSGQYARVSTLKIIQYILEGFVFYKLAQALINMAAGFIQEYQQNQEKKKKKQQEEDEKNQLLLQQEHV